MANPNGGFYAFWWNEQEDKECKQYLQLEEDCLCFKIHVHENDKGNRRKLRNEWSTKLIEQSRTCSFSLEKPRFGNGKYMTVAVLKDYRVKGEEGRIDMCKTMGVLCEVEGLLKLVAKRVKS